MKKNGFTLIELLAIIVLLGTIFTITLSPLKKFINNTCLKAYEINLDSMKDAASGYVLKANIEVPSGIQTRIELSDLIARKLMNRIVDPKSKEECDGYVTVTMLNDAYHFTSYLDCGSNYKSPDYGKTDYVLPVITLLGDNPVTINAGETYIEPGFTANDDVDGDITNKVKSTGYINPNLPGTYEITYSVTDNANNFFEIKRRVIVIDNASPIIIFGTNGNSTYAKSYSTTVTVTDNVSVNTSSLKYQWTTSATAPTEASFSTSFTNGGTITSQAGVTGSYYLWILAKDTSGNATITRTNLFNLDNIKPIITMSGNSSITIEKGSTYSDAGATATDYHSGLNGSVTSTGSVNPNLVGTYTITYNVSDKAGNAANPVTRTVIVAELVIATDEACFGFDVSTGTIYGYNEYNPACPPNVVIPSQIGGIMVKALGYYSFCGRGLVSVTIPTSVTYIGEGAFGNNMLTSVVIPSSVTYIGYNAFDSNQLTNVIISEGITTIDSYAFENNMLTSVVIPSSVIAIGVSAFGNNMLTSVVIPSSVTYIGERAFFGNQLTSVVIPSGVTYMGYGAFNNNLLPDNQAFLYARNADGSINNTEVIGYGGVNKSPIIPSGVTYVGYSAFSSSNLIGITIPNSVTYVGYNAFSSNNLTSITIPNSVTAIDPFAFAYNKLTSVVIPSNVTKIGDYAFTSNNLTSITMMSSGVTVGKNLLTNSNNSFKTSYGVGGAGTYKGTQTGTSWIKQ